MPTEKQKFINREISWLSFNARVLQEAQDPNVPLIERIKFLGIFSSNLDEFFRVRVASLTRSLELSQKEKKIFGGNPKKILTQIQDTVIELTDQFEATYELIVQEMQQHSVYILNEKELDETQGAFVRTYFHDKVRPTLVPLMVDATTPFPSMRDKSIYLAIKLSSREHPRSKKYSLIEVPTDTIPRFLVLPSEKNIQYIILIDDVIRYCLDEIFHVFDFPVREAWTVKLTRDSELALDDDLSDTILQKISRSLKQRKKGRPVRFIYDETISPDLLNFIIRRLHMTKSDNVIPGARYHNFKDFIKFPLMSGASMSYIQHHPLPHPDLPERSSIFERVSRRDVMLQYPYHSFGHVIDFLREAAIDPQVESVKMTLYRVARNSNIVNALINAVRNGKAVTVVVELQARFDEEANIYWANKLREEGVKVIFGVPDMKVHCKLCLITRMEKRRTVRYAYIGTGNFNESTSRLYSDIGLFTCDERITTEVNQVFQFLDNNLRTAQFRHLLVSPFYMRQELIRLIDKEIKSAELGAEASLLLKMNSLVDEVLILKLYEASKAGVKIRMIIRGTCSLNAGVKGLSDNIEAISIVDRYLEHARVYVFGNGGSPRMYFGSADMMTRNLDHRIEVLAPIYDVRIRDRILEYLELQWQDNVKARIVERGQENRYRTRNSTEKIIRSQETEYIRLQEISLAQSKSGANSDTELISLSGAGSGK